MSAPIPTDNMSEDELSSLQQIIIDILDGGQVMSLATNRSDGWPQVTHVNYLRDGPALYFLVARDSQKFANILRDPRVGVAIADTRRGAEAVRGVSLSARVSEIVQPHRITEINALIHRRPPEQRFAPHPSGANVAVLEAQPEVISVIDYTRPPGERKLVRMVEDWRLASVSPQEGLAASGPDWRHG